MRRENILAQPGLVLSEDQRTFFFEEGYLALEGFVPAAALAAMRASAAAAVERTRSLESSNADFALEPDHAPDRPRPRRLYRATEQDTAFWAYASRAPLVDLAADLVGPDVRYREAYINYKWAGGGTEVKWHQDLPFFPHTNRALITAITYLADVTPEMGPIAVVPGSHLGEIYDHYDERGEWAGSLSDADFARLPHDAVTPLPGPAGTLVVFDGLTLHSSARNRTDAPRPALIVGYSSADAFPYTEMPPEHTDRHAWEIVRGRPAVYAEHEPLPVKVPPDWRRNAYEPIFDAQAAGHDAEVRGDTAA